MNTDVYPTEKVSLAIIEGELIINRTYDIDDWRERSEYPCR